MWARGTFVTRPTSRHNVHDNAWFLLVSTMFMTFRLLIFAEPSSWGNLEILKNIRLDNNNNILLKSVEKMSSSTLYTYIRPYVFNIKLLNVVRIEHLLCSYRIWRLERNIDMQSWFNRKSVSRDRIYFRKINSHCLCMKWTHANQTHSIWLAPFRRISTGWQI